ncbi:hypothetical protein GCM10010104_31590 [Streptomyces indiaensis]|uniref:Uncharacterized protein n=1 Tax=Streptomyces indiaensis TaxID=284033 RepID=A0ABN3DKI3_9ACTN
MHAGARPVAEQEGERDEVLVEVGRDLDHGNFLDVGQRWPWYSFFTVSPAKARTPTATRTNRISKKISTGCSLSGVRMGAQGRRPAYAGPFGTSIPD